MSEFSNQLESPVNKQVDELSEASAILQEQIAERKGSEERLARSEEHYRNVAEIAPDAIITSNEEGVITFVNRAAERVFGYASADLLGFKIVMLMPEYLRHIHKASPKTYIATGNRQLEYWECIELTGLKRGGLEIPVELSVSRFAKNDKHVFTCIVRDIAGRKQAEAQLKTLAADLLHSNRELQDFASVASHDLQEPLRKIQTFADDLAKTSISTLSDESRDTLKRIQSGAGRMQRLISDLLSLSRITSRPQPFVRVDLNRIAREVLSDLEVPIRETGGRVDLGEIPAIDAEPLQMRQLFQNLVGNALKFNSPGRNPIVSVRGELISDGRLPGGTEAGEQQFCQITVKDNGIGFDEKYVDRIFAMFQRLHGRNEYEGTGMGLAICRRIAEHHGGNITARSIPGTGSTFTVKIPTKRTQELSNTGIADLPPETIGA